LTFSSCGRPDQRQRLGALEQSVTSSGRAMKDMALAELEREWQAAKDRHEDTKARNSS
jgi:hypothetical protein